MYRGAPPDSNDYNSHLEFPPHQLMEPAQNNFSSQPQYRPTPQPSVPQVFIEFHIFFGHNKLSIIPTKKIPEVLFVYIRE